MYTVQTDKEQNLIDWVGIVLATINGNTFGLSETEQLEAIKLAANGLKISFDDFNNWKFIE